LQIGKKIVEGIQASKADLPKLESAMEEMDKESQSYRDDDMSGDQVVAAAKDVMGDS
jgi:hypothetical protein